MSPHEAKIQAVVDHPAALDAYRRWLNEQDAVRGDYLFTMPRVRFEPRPGDVVRPMPGLSVEGDADEAVLAGGEARLPVPGVARKQARRLIEAMDGRCLLEVAWEADEASLGALLRVGFGKVVFAPEAVEALEAQVPGVEIVRFPQAPYAIERAYWENAGAVTARLPDLPNADVDAFWRGLRKAHVVLLMGERLDRFYRPASPGARRGFIAPGALFEDPVITRDGAEPVTVLLGGPRVNVAHGFGSTGFAEALVGSLVERFPKVMQAFTQAADEHDGLPWGRVVWGRGRGDDAAKSWFLPPRPIDPAHLAFIFEAWRQRDSLEALASLHWAFVRLHPFACGNQSLVMAMVNHALRRQGRRGIPHLVLDHWALRLDLPTYRHVFARAVAAYGGAERAPAERLKTLIRLSGQLQRAMQADEVREEDRVGALLVDP